jgi:uncharacterized protein (TIGR04255 family)
LFISEESNFLVQLQDSRLHLNWRKVKPTESYPRFPRIYPEFVSIREQLNDFVKKNGIGEIKPEKYELTYVNHIDTNAGNFASSLEENVKLFNWSRVEPRRLTAPYSAAASWHFQMDDNMGDLIANLTHVRTNDQAEVLVLALGCTATPKPDLAIDDWYKAAHDAIVYGFADLTTETAQKRWGREQ